MQNGDIVSFSGKFRDEHLNAYWFETLHQARMGVAAWRTDYNEVWPYSSLGRMPPARFAERHLQRAGDAAQFPSTPRPLSNLKSGLPRLIGTCKRGRSALLRQDASCFTKNFQDYFFAWTQIKLYPTSAIIVLGTAKVKIS